MTSTQISSQSTIQQNDNGHILVVDDEMTNRDLLKLTLAKQGYLITLAKNGEEALELIQARTFDLVLLDIMMPGVDGIAVLKAIRENHSLSELPVVMATAIDADDQIANALSLGANDYITKPFNKKILLARVKTQTALAQSYNKASALAEDVSRRNKLLLKLFGRYITDEVATDLISSPASEKRLVEEHGEKQKAAILFANIRNFAEITQGMSPAHTIEMLNNFFDVMIDVIRKYRGTVDKLVGDEILATFGISISRADDTERALACALEMQLAMQRVNERNRINNLPELEIGIGVNTGEVLVGNLGSKKYTHYSVIGKNVNLAARIEACAESGEVMISESALMDGGLEVWVDSKREFIPKDIDRSIIIYRLSGLGGKYQLSLEQGLQKLGNSW